MPASTQVRSKDRPGTGADRPKRGPERAQFGAGSATVLRLASNELFWKQLIEFEANLTNA